LRDLDTDGEMLLKRYMTLNFGMYHILMRLSTDNTSRFPIPLSARHSFFLPIWTSVAFDSVLFRESTGKSLCGEVYSIESRVTCLSLSK
jgi:hypothetical protein